MDPTSEPEAFAKRLHQCCRMTGIAERSRNTKLASIFGVSPQGARKWLEGDAIPSMQNAVTIARYFGVDVNWLLTGSGDEPSPMTAHDRQMLDAFRRLNNADRDALLHLATRLADQA